MCIICLDFDRGALKVPEARRALGEMRRGLGEPHAREIEQKLEAAELLEGATSAPPSSARP